MKKIVIVLIIVFNTISLFSQEKELLLKKGSSQKETCNWEYYYNMGDSLLNNTSEANISYSAVLNDGTTEQVFNTTEINMYVNIPYCESGDWNNVLAYVYNKEGVLKVLIRKSSFFNSVCSEGVLSEKQVFANESDRMIEKIHTVYDENNNIVKDTSGCVFNYRFEYPIYFNYSEIPVIQKYECKPKKVMLDARVYDRTYVCDSISVPTYDFIFEDDSAVYSVMKKELFNFKMKIDRNHINIEGDRYHYLCAGLNIDTIGLINITENSYQYKKTKSENESALLFDFSKRINDSWVIKEDGYFKNYEVRLTEVNYDELLRDSVYTFTYNFVGKRFPNGYYFEKFDVSKRYGIMGYSLSNGVECRCKK